MNDATMAGLPAPQRAALSAALERFGVHPAGPIRTGWRGRSVSLPVLGEGGPRWLRLVAAPPALARGEWWTGNADSNAIVGIRKPEVLHVDDVRLENSVVRVELQTLLPGEPCSAERVLRTDPGLDDRWWRELENATAALASAQTSRAATTEAALAHRISVIFGPDAPRTTDHWRTAHGDLHWGNVLHRPFGLVDWEGWGRAPHGYDIATLYLHALLVPSIASAIAERFGDVLFGQSGRVALHSVATTILARAMSGEHPDLVAPVHRAIATMTTPLKGPR